MDIWITLLITIVSLVVGSVITFFVARHYAERRALSINYETIEIIKENHEYKKLNIKYGKDVISELYRSDFVVKNVGNKSILKNEIIDPIIVELPEDTNIFDIEYKSASHKSIKPHIAQERNTRIRIEFAFLEKSDRFEFVLIHNAPRRIGVQGRVSDCEIKINDSFQKQLWSHWIAGIIMGVLPLVVVGIFIFNSVSSGTYEFSELLLLLLLSGMAFSSIMVLRQFGGLIRDTNRKKRGQV